MKKSFKVVVVDGSTQEHETVIVQAYSELGALCEVATSPQYKYWFPVWATEVE